MHDRSGKGITVKKSTISSSDAWLELFAARTVGNGEVFSTTLTLASMPIRPRS